MNNTFINTRFSKRDYESTNIVACIAEKAPNNNWIPSESPDALKGLDRLWSENGVQYYGYL